jgi:hypothetical protein
MADEHSNRRHVNEAATDSALQIMNETTLKFFGRIPKDAVEKGECVVCSNKVDITMHPQRLERYRICGICSECQHDWLPDLFNSGGYEFVDRVKKPKIKKKQGKGKDKRYVRSRSTLLEHWDVLENTTVPVLAVRTKLSPSTLRRQIADMMQQELVEEIIVKRKQGGTGLLTYTLLKEVKDDLY